MARGDFWSHVRKSNDCWDWLGYRAKTGYGESWSRTAHRSVGAHRVAWELVNGPIPAGLWVLHTCDRKSCVRPDHLYLGTIVENRQDALDRSRYDAGARHWSHRRPSDRVRGERHGLSRLSTEQVRQIRQEAAAGASHRSLARTYGVDHTTVKAIVDRKTWIHV